MGLTDTQIKKLSAADKPFRVSDSRGLYLEVSPAGGKWWRWKYRFGGKEKRLSLGVYPDVSLKDARERRDEARKLLASGIDPSVARKAKKAARAEASENSFEVIAREWFAKFEPGWAESHSVRMLRLFERDVFPWIGSKAITEIESPELLSVLRRIEARGAIETAHRARTKCGQVFRYAIATARCKRDPSADLRGALPPVKEEHFAATTEPKRLGEILRLMDSYGGTPVVCSALRLAPLVFVRPGELRMARWVDIDLDAAEWKYRITKTRTDHVVPLSKQAVAILKDLRPLTGNGPLVFPSARGRGRPMSDNAVLAAMRYLDIKKEEMTGHGFRAIARTHLDETLGFPAHLLEHQLGHAVRDPLGRAYNRTAHLSERKKMMQQWADYLDQLKSEHSAHGFAGRNLVS
jgi:integrase